MDLDDCNWKVMDAQMQIIADKGKNRSKHKIFEATSPIPIRIKIKKAVANIEDQPLKSEFGKQWNRNRLNWFLQLHYITV